MKCTNCARPPLPGRTRCEVHRSAALEYARRNQGYTGKRAVISESLRRTIRSMRANGHGAHVVAELTGVSVTSVRRIENS